MQLPFEEAPAQRQLLAHLAGLLELVAAVPRGALDRDPAAGDTLAVLFEKTATVFDDAVAQHRAVTNGVLPEAQRRWVEEQRPAIARLLL